MVRPWFFEEIGLNGNFGILLKDAKYDFHNENEEKWGKERRENKGHMSIRSRVVEKAEYYPMVENEDGRRYFGNLLRSYFR